LHQKPPLLLLIKLELDRSDFLGRLGVGGLDRPEHLAGFAHEHDAPAALHTAGELGGAVSLAGAAGRHGENIVPTLPQIECGRIAGMADHTHTMDRWDDATGEKVIEQIAGVGDYLVALR